MAEPVVTPDRARQHEAIVIRLEALLTELRPLVLRHPAAPVPGELAVVAEGLLFDTHRFLPRRSNQRQAFPAAAPDLAGLVVQLGQAQASLDQFEVRHSFWSETQRAYVWRLGPDRDLPVARLKPKLSATALEEQRQGDSMRDKVVRLIRAQVEEAYEQGRADAEAGRDTGPSA